MHASDWFVMILVAAIWVAATVWIFLHASAEAFGMWCGLAATLGGVYHWLTIRDDKLKDEK
jgi:hypothetical protein